MALLRADARLWTPGQVKPTGVPRIDWSHPLAQGLLFYGFDTGMGAVIDLVGGRAGAHSAAGTVLAPNGATQWGAGIAWNNDDQYIFAADAAIRAAQLNPFTFACACVSTATQQAHASPFMRDANGASNPFCNWDWEAVSGSLQCKTLASGSQVTIGSQAFSNNAFMSLVGVTPTPTTGAYYFNGALVASGSLGGTISNNSVNDSIYFSGNEPHAAGAGLDGQWTGYVFYGAFWARPLNAAEVLQLHLDPYCFLLPAGGEMAALLSAGGSTYNVTITEAGSAGETVAAILAALSAMAEAGTAADSQASNATLPSAQAEAGSAADTPASTATLPSSVSDSLTATDTASTTAVLPSAVTEAGSVVDTLTGGLLVVAAILESGTATDANSAVLALALQIAEAGTAAHTNASTAHLLAALAEAGAASDLAAAGAHLTAAIGETVTAQAIVDATLAVSLALAEVGIATDSLDATILGQLILAFATARDTAAFRAAASDKASSAGASDTAPKAGATDT